MKAFSPLVSLLLFPLSTLAEPASQLQEELLRYDQLSHSLVSRVGKIERNARNCYKNLPVGYKAIIAAKGVFGLFNESTRSLEANRSSVKLTFNKLLTSVAEKPDTSSVDACSGSSSAAATELAKDGSSVTLAKNHLTAMEKALKKTKKDLSNPSDRKNIEYLIDCGDPTALRNFHAALKEYEQLVATHEKLSGYLAANEKSLIANRASNLAVSQSCSELAWK